MWSKIDVYIFALAIATVTAMPNKQDDKNETTVDSEAVPSDVAHPCNPNPCGANSVCTVKNNVGSCTCLPEYVGNPYEGCRPECIVSSDCSSNQACIRSRCKDPCPGTCGMNAECKAINHIPICLCSANYTGNPFSYCTPIDAAACLSHTDCRPGLACLREKCVDPCIGTCGENAVCEVPKHTAICSCPEGTIGDPFVKCRNNNENPALPLTFPSNCSPSPCGPNSQCQVIDDHISCSCLPTYLGSPPNCRPQCIINMDCPSTSACINQKCVDPCPGACGKNAICRVLNYTPICSCPSGTSGDPFVDCKENAPCLDHTECSEGQACLNKKCVDPCIGVCGENAACKVSNLTPICKCPVGRFGDPFVKCTNFEVPALSINPCVPSPCGPNSMCRSSSTGRAICSCLPTYLGSPPACRPECVLNSECPSNSSCINQKCVDPCRGACGHKAICTVLNHIPICSCPSDMFGDPFVACKSDSALSEKSKCSKNADCDAKEACIEQRCGDPCAEGLCGENAECTVVKHIAVCLCPPRLLNDQDGPCFYAAAEHNKPDDKTEKTSLQ